MQTFSSHIKNQEPTTQRRLYTLFQREVKQGRLPALKVLTRFEILRTDGQPRQVQDFVYTDEVGQQVSSWIDNQLEPQAKGLTLEQVQAMSDDDLTALIQQQTKTPKKRKVRADKGVKKTKNAEAQAAQGLSENREDTGGLF